jgi:hypothetical protein
VDCALVATETLLVVVAPGNVGVVEEVAYLLVLNAMQRHPQRKGQMAGQACFTLAEQAIIVVQAGMGKV